VLHRGDPGDELASGSLGDQDQVYDLPDAYDEARRACEAGYRVYFTKSGIFSKDHIWPRMKDGVVDSRDLIPAYEFFQSYGASMGPAQAIAIKIVG